jgi:glutamate racemase
MKIGVFDSGIGGEKIANLIRTIYPRAEVYSVSDVENLPYGNKTNAQLRRLVMPKLLQMQADGCEYIVIACNTVTTVLMQDIRQVLNVPVIGFEPMVKPAVQLTKTGTIAICATNATLNSSRYATLKRLYASNIQVFEPDCSDWASLIEQNTITETQIRRVVDESLAKNADVIVLGCTHYHWIEKEIAQLAEGRAIVMQPEAAVMQQLKTVIETSVTK